MATVPVDANNKQIAKNGWIKASQGAKRKPSKFTGLYINSEWDSLLKKHPNMVNK